MTCRVLELFAGIGGLRCAWPEATLVAAVDINQIARDVYLRNHSGPYHIREIASMRSSDARISAFVDLGICALSELLATQACCWP